MSNDSRDVGYAVFFFCFGIWSFFCGFKWLRRKRKIENIPTSTVRGLAIGLAELVGKAKKTGVLISPLTKSQCVFYRYLVERYQNSGRSGRWVTIVKGDSYSRPFWLEDATGKVLVFPQGVEVIMDVDYSFQTGIGNSLPANLIDFLDSNSIQYKGLFGTSRLRFKEWCIYENDQVYVLGTALNTQGQDYLGGHRDKLTRWLAELKNNPQEMSKLDLNQDGQISIEEWDLAVSGIEKELLEEELKAGLKEDNVNVVIAKGEADKTFILSDYSQKDLIESLSWKAFWGVFGGAALSLLMLAYLLFRFKVFD